MGVADAPKAIEAMAPGLYEMKIAEVAGEGLDKRFTIDFEERTIEELRAMDDGRIHAEADLREPERQVVGGDHHVGQRHQGAARAEGAAIGQQQHRQRRPARRHALQVACLELARRALDEARDQQVVVLRQMPMNNATGITEAERALIGEWFKAGARTQ